MKKTFTTLSKEKQLSIMQLVGELSLALFEDYCEPKESAPGELIESIRVFLNNPGDHERYLFGKADEKFRCLVTRSLGKADNFRELHNSIIAIANVSSFIYSSENKEFIFSATEALEFACRASDNIRDELEKVFAKLESQ